MTDYNALKVPDLKTMLGQRKLLQAGNKQALIARLQEDDEKNAPASADDKTGECSDLPRNAFFPCTHASLATAPETSA